MLDSYCYHHLCYAFFLLLRFALLLPVSFSYWNVSPYILPSQSSRRRSRSGDGGGGGGGGGSGSRGPGHGSGSRTVEVLAVVVLVVGGVRGRCHRRCCHGQHRPLHCCHRLCYHADHVAVIGIVATATN